MRMKKEEYLAMKHQLSQLEAENLALRSSLIEVDREDVNRMRYEIDALTKMNQTLASLAEAN